MVKLLYFYPQVVAHQSTNPAQYCLTSVSDENWCFQCCMVLDIINAVEKELQVNTKLIFI